MLPDATVLVLVRDLILASRVTATAKELGVPYKLLRKPEALAGETGRLLIVDLNLELALEGAAAWQKLTQCDVVGFVAHVDAETINRARTAGLQKVLARSRFVELLPEILKS